MKTMRVSIAWLMGFVLIAAVGLAGLKVANPYWASGCCTLMLVVLVAAILNAIQGRGKGRAYWIGFAVAGWTYCVISFGSLVSLEEETFPTLINLGIEHLGALIHPEMSSYTTTASWNGTGWTTTASLTVPTMVATPAPVVPASLTTTPLPAAMPAPVAPPTPVGTPISFTPVPILPGSSPTPPTPAPIAAPVAPTPTFVVMPSGNPTLVHYGQVAHSMAALLAGMLGGLYSVALVVRRERREAARVEEVSPSSP